jgi:hypothetical protein
MTIEIAPKEYHRLLTIHDSIMYCFSLNVDSKVGWRLPTELELLNEMGGIGWAWHQGDVSAPSHDNIDWCYPVRDVK